MAPQREWFEKDYYRVLGVSDTASQKDIKSAYRLSWELALKAKALYRDGCKLSQVLNSAADTRQAYGPQPPSQLVLWAGLVAGFAVLIANVFLTTRRRSRRG